MNALLSPSRIPLTIIRAAGLPDLGYTPQCPPLRSLVANKFDGDEHQLVAGATLFWGSGRSWVLKGHLSQGAGLLVMKAGPLTKVHVTGGVLGADAQFELLGGGG